MANALQKLLTRLETPTYTLLRVVAGGMFAFHGVQKILGWLAKNPPPAVGSQLWFGGLIELVAGTLILFGLATRPAAFLAAGTMAVAYFQFHWKLVFAGWRWIPAVNAGELAVLYCFLFLFIVARGGGPASLDRLLRRA